MTNSFSQEQVAWRESDLIGNPHEAADKAARVRRMFAAIARSYDLNNRLHSFGRDQAWRRAAVRMADVRPGDDVLDVACGTGDLTEAFADAGPHSVIGVDFTEEMLVLARQKCARRRARLGMRANAKAKMLQRVQPTYLHADALNLPFPDGSFDIVSIAFGIRNVSDPFRAMCEFRRVLRRGGRLVILEFSQPTNRVLRFFHQVYCVGVMPRTATLIARDRSGAYRYLPQSVATFMQANELIAMIQACGFANVESHRLTFGICTATAARRP
jgi:demethylmenaquinone methyltransferase/2-methoxy-6-polyprenyl-1,4-benzoquinol methylase